MYANVLDMAFSHCYRASIFNGCDVVSVIVPQESGVLCEPLRSNPDKHWELCYGNINRNYGVIEQMSSLALIGLKDYVQLYTLMPFFPPLLPKCK